MYGSLLHKISLNDPFYLEFEPSPQLKYDLMNKGGRNCSKIEERFIKKRKFSTHKELDNFYEKLRSWSRSFCKEFDDDYRDDYNLLMIIDRLFWARHIANETDEKFIPLSYKSGPDLDYLCHYAGINVECRTGCPFGYPTIYD